MCLAERHVMQHKKAFGGFFCGLLTMKDRPGRLLAHDQAATFKSFAASASHRRASSRRTSSGVIQKLAFTQDTGRKRRGDVLRSPVKIACGKANKIHGGSHPSNRFA